MKLPSGVSEELWILVSTHFETFPSHCLSLISHLLQLNTTPGQVLEDNLTKLILQENLNDELKFGKRWFFFSSRIYFYYINRIKLSTVLKMLASSAAFDRMCTNLLMNLINSWTGKI